MARNPSAYLEDAIYMIEGSPGLAEDNEPANPLRTTTIPAAVPDEINVNPSSETGILPTAHIRAEGQDNEDSQDASLTTSETKTAMVKQSKRSNSDNPVVLIVEDTIELAEVIEATLERMDMTTAHETHGSRALEQLQSLKPDVVLLDINLPDMTGWEIMDAMKAQADAANDDMPIIIIITALDDPANRLVGKLQDIHSYLIKPFTADDIERVVTQALNS